MTAKVHEKQLRCIACKKNPRHGRWTRCHSCMLPIWQRASRKGWISRKRRALAALAIAVTAAAFAQAGEWITTEDTGMPVCRLTQPLYFGEVFARSDCEDWTIPLPEYGQRIDRTWMRCDNGCQLHFRDGWRP